METSRRTNYELLSELKGQIRGEYSAERVWRVGISKKRSLVAVVQEIDQANVDLG